MKKFLCLVISVLLCASFGPVTGEAAANSSLSMGSIKAGGTKVYSSPAMGSAVTAVLNKGEEYPVISTVAGDSASPVVHTVVSGNTLWTISTKYGVSISAIQKQNKLTTTKLRIGQKLTIPQVYQLHTVVSGDTLWKIANKYGVTVSDLTKLNSLRSTSLYIGQKIKIPDYYCQLQLLGGQKGWVKKSLLQLKTQKRLTIGWSYNGTTETYAKQMEQPNLNVVSPRWYNLTSSENFISMSVDTKYAEAAHAKGKQVWPLVGNRFDPVLTDSILSSAVNRQKLVTALTDSLVKTNSDGVNIDFENVNIKNKQDYVLFIGELKKALQPHGILLSVDVSRENEDPFWSGSLDRKELGKIADYIVMMGYDEHWGGSPKAGSVASLPWTQEGIELLMKDVPSHKIILAVPFYTREWVTDLATNKVRSIDRTMAEVDGIIASNKLQKVWDTKTSQNYVEYTANNEKHQIWIEDKKSIELRMNLVKQHYLGGAAAWYLGSETPDVWDVYNFN